MQSDEQKLKFYKWSLYSTALFLLIMVIAFSYTIYDFQRNIKSTVENDLSQVKVEIERAIRAANSSEFESVAHILSQEFVGAVIPFNCESCPSGWKEYEPAYGRFIRGIDRGVIKQDSDGERSAGSVQSDSTRLPNNPFSGTTAKSGQHTHQHQAPRPYDSGAGNHARAKPDSQANTSPSGEHVHTIVVNSGGDSETRPKNIALLYCQKL